MAAPSIDREIRRAVRDLTPRLIEDRRHFHRHPELSWKEHQTQAAILDRLRAIDGVDDIQTIASTGVTALVQGNQPGPCVLWRADIDALPIPEHSALPFASGNEGVMHACGHDAHIAIALAIVRALASARDQLTGSVRFVFQPAEEAEGGARDCIAEGILDAPHVTSAFGLHISADVPLGAINLAPGPFFAAPTGFTIEITGRGGHAAAPHQGIDAIVVAAHAIVALQTVVSRSINPLETVVLTVGTVNAGYRHNVMAGAATITGTIRTYTPAVLDHALRRVDEIVGGVCAAFGAAHTFAHVTGCPPLVNDGAMTGLVLAEASRFFGEDNIYGAPSMGAEDMSEFLRARPGCYLWLGARNEAKGIAGRHHDSGFVIDEDALPLGVEFGLRMLNAALAAAER